MSDKKLYILETSEELFGSQKRNVIIALSAENETEALAKMTKIIETDNPPINESEKPQPKVEDTGLELIKKDIVLPKLKGALINEAKDTFKNWIDSDFKNWNLNSKTSSKETKVSVYEITKDGTFEDIFSWFNYNSLDELVMTQGQIIEFCKNHKEELGQNWYNFFLIKENGEYFVVLVSVYSDGLSVYVNRLEHDSVWHAGFRHRVFVPQLDI
jgi:hypothetical protein